MTELCGEVPDWCVMGLSLRIFLVNDDDSIQRLALARYDRLLERDPKERLPQYAGKRVRYALVVVDLTNREPVEILRIQYSYLFFDSEGRVDPTEREKEARLAFNILPPEPVVRDFQQVVEARHYFAKKRYKDEYRWTPTAEIESAIVRAIFDTSQYA